MWEYARFTFKYKLSDELMSELNEIGLVGWEIIKYTEIQPKMFGENWECTVITKRKIDKPCSREIL